MRNIATRGFTRQPPSTYGKAPKSAQHRQETPTSLIRSLPLQRKTAHPSPTPNTVSPTLADAERLFAADKPCGVIPPVASARLSPRSPPPPAARRPTRRRHIRIEMSRVQSDVFTRSLNSSATPCSRPPLLPSCVVHPPLTPLTCWTDQAGIGLGRETILIGRGSGEIRVLLT